MGKMSKDELSELQNPENWEDEADAVRPAVKSARAIVSVAFSREDFEDVAEYAQRHGMKTSEFIRRAILERVSPERDAAVVVSVSGGVLTSYPVVGAPRPKISVETPQPPVFATA